MSLRGSFQIRKFAHVLFMFFFAGTLAHAEDLTGSWIGDDGATYYVTQVGDQVWWLGISDNRGFTNVFHGRIAGAATPFRVVGEWADVPLGGSNGNGELSLNIIHIAAPPGEVGRTDLAKDSETGGFSASRWRRGVVATPPNNTGSSGSTPAPTGSARSLTGAWKGDDGATYYVRQVGNRVWWAGLSNDDGKSFTNVFQGTWEANPATEEPSDRGSVSGNWVDVPRGGTQQGGALRLSLRFSGELEKKAESGSFGATRWTRLE